MCLVRLYWETILGSLYLVSSRLQHIVPFPFDYFALYPFALINHSCEYYYMLSPISSARKSLNFGVVLGSHPHTVGVRSGIQKDSLI